MRAAYRENQGQGDSRGEHVLGGDASDCILTALWADARGHGRRNVLCCRFIDSRRGVQVLSLLHVP